MSEHKDQELESQPKGKVEETLEKLQRQENLEINTIDDDVNLDGNVNLSQPDLSQPYDKIRESYEIQKIITDIEDLKKTNQLRLKYANNIFRLTCYWLVFVGFIVFLSGLNLHILKLNFSAIPGSYLLYYQIDLSEFYEFHLADSVLIAFMTTTTISILGIILIVAKWLFPKIKEEDKSSSEKDV
ncbi:hypothetical protein [Psychrobacter sp. I-STPA10]|uniref:hypothetical protein n=1 Tax=Psychrobacter sp. I-STPA10 TaxID=2585769 RepID=UPI001E40EFBE|nr:hypothetical protein [Psychrobacter sp. I-STPA10]